MPVETSAAPLPSRSTRPVIRVSLVLRSTVATRTILSSKRRACAAGPCNNFRARFPLGASAPRHSALDPDPAQLTPQFPGNDLRLNFPGVPSAASDADRGMDYSGNNHWHGTTILCLRKGGQVVVAGDGQVTMGQTVVKSNARKLRRLAGGSVIAGFAGATADAITLFERLEGKLEQYAGQLSRACVELAKDWRTDRYLRRLEAMMAVADKSVSLILSGTGDVLEPEDGIIGIGSGGGYSLAGGRGPGDIHGLGARTVARRGVA